MMPIGDVYGDIMYYMTMDVMCRRAIYSIRHARSISNFQAIHVLAGLTSPASPRSLYKQARIKKEFHSAVSVNEDEISKAQK